MNIVTCDADRARETRLRLWSEPSSRPSMQSTDPQRKVIDAIRRKTAEEQARLGREGLSRTQRMTLLPSLSRRTDRLEGPMRGLLVDG